MAGGSVGHPFIDASLGSLFLSDSAVCCLTQCVEMDRSLGTSAQGLARAAAVSGRVTTQVFRVLASVSAICMQTQQLAFLHRCAHRENPVACGAPVKSMAYRTSTAHSHQPCGSSTEHRRTVHLDRPWHCATRATRATTKGRRGEWGHRPIGSTGYIKLGPNPLFY